LAETFPPFCRGWSSLAASVDHFSRRTRSCKKRIALHGAACHQHEPLENGSLENKTTCSRSRVARERSSQPCVSNARSCASSIEKPAKGIYLELERFSCRRRSSIGGGGGSREGSTMRRSIRSRRRWQTHTETHTHARTMIKLSRSCIQTGSPAADRTSERTRTDARMQSHKLSDVVWSVVRSGRPLVCVFEQRTASLI
jgi:hypothetical protein